MHNRSKQFLPLIVTIVFGYLVFPFFAQAVTDSTDVSVTALVLVTPKFSLPEGAYVSGMNVKLTSLGQDFIQYTKDNSTPTCSHGTRYTAPITLTATVKIRAVACYQSTKASNIASATFTIPCLENCSVNGGAFGFIGAPPLLPSVRSVPIVGNKPTTPVVVLPQKPSVTSAEQVFLFKKSIGRGSVGIDVLALQRKLQKLGYFSKNVTPTNFYGLVTFKAVQNFQKANRLSPLTGELGPKTRAALNAIK